MKPGPGSRPRLGQCPVVRTASFNLIADKYNETLIEPPAYEFSGDHNKPDYPALTGIYDPALQALVDND